MPASFSATDRGGPRAPAPQGPPGRFRLRLAGNAADLAAAQALRHLGFFGRPGRDGDAQDALCQHVLIEETGGAGRLVATFRYRVFAAGQGLEGSYSAGVYDLSALAGVAGAKAELGRFCLHPECHDPDLLRLAWAALARVVDGAGVTVLFGCASFAGTDPWVHRETLARLGRAHLGPAGLRPGRRATETRALPAGAPGDPRAGLRGMPPLLRTYLQMGGWTGDHLVIDREMGTLHVFCAVEVAAIPPARARQLRALAAQLVQP